MGHLSIPSVLKYLTEYNFWISLECAPPPSRPLPYWAKLFFGIKLGRVSSKKKEVSSHEKIKYIARWSCLHCLPDNSVNYLREMLFPCIAPTKRRYWIRLVICSALSNLFLFALEFSRIFFVSFIRKILFGKHCILNS